jgi:hypothetical protein
MNGVSSGEYASAEISETTTYRPPATYFIRSFLLVPSPAPAAHFDLISSKQSSGAFRGIALRLENGRLVTENDIASPTVKRTMSTAFPTDVWVCVELELRLTSPGQVNVWFDDTAVPELSAAQTTTGVAMQQLAYGIFLPAQNAVGAFDIFYDEILIDDQRIGCTKHERIDLRSMQSV